MFIATIFGLLIGYIIAEVFFGVTRAFKRLISSYLRLLESKPLVGIIGTIAIFLLVHFRMLIIWEAIIVVIFILAVFVIIDNQERKAQQQYEDEQDFE